jgi:hypothetical protein
LHQVNRHCFTAAIQPPRQDGETTNWTIMTERTAQVEAGIP